MNDNDLIRRGDVIAILSAASRTAQKTIDAIAALARIRSALTVTTHDPASDVVEIDLRAVMMEQIEEAAAQSPWVPPEYTMNEVVSDCCSFLREDQHDPAAVRALMDAAEKLLEAYSAIFGAGNPWGDELRAALAAANARADRAEAALAALEYAPRVNETPKSEHASADVLTTPPAPWVKDHAAPKEPTK